MSDQLYARYLKRLEELNEYVEQHSVVNDILTEYLHTIHALNLPTPALSVMCAIEDITGDLVLLSLPPPLPEPPEGNVPAARWRDRAHEAMTALQDFDDLFATTKIAIVKCLVALTPYIPQTEESSITTPLQSFITEPNTFTEQLVLPFFEPSVIERNLFTPLRTTLDMNLCAASGFPYSKENAESPKVILPSQFKGNAPEPYLAGTPLLRLLQVPIPLSIPKHLRFEHMWVLAGSGHGKTQLFQYMISHDLDEHATVVVIDSQSQLIENISKLEKAKDKLVLIDPTDTEYPVALNLFDVPAYDDKTTNSAIELLEYVLGALLGADLTSKQGTLFRFTLRLMLAIPNATIHTFSDIMDNGVEAYEDTLKTLSPTVQRFFKTQFNERQFRHTREEVNRRLWTVMENQSLLNMLSHRETKFDIGKELDQGKVILINTAKDFLKQHGTEILGRYFIAQIALAIQERRPNQCPIYLYIDEIQDYARGGESNIEALLEQARKRNCGLVMAHHTLDQIGKLQPILSANTSIKFAGGTGYKDAVALAKEMRSEPEFIRDMPKGTFAASMKSKAISFSVPFLHMEQLPRVSDEDWQEIIATNRRRYAVHKSELEEPASDIEENTDTDTDDISPSTDY